MSSIANVGTLGGNWIVPTPGGTRTAPTIETVSGRRVFRFPSAKTAALYLAAADVPQTLFVIMRVMLKGTLTNLDTLMVTGQTANSYGLNLISKVNTTTKWGGYGSNYRAANTDVVVDSRYTLSYHQSQSKAVPLGTFFFDGVHDGTAAELRGIQNPAHGNGYYIGASLSGSTGYQRACEMDVEEVLIYDASQMTAAEISTALTMTRTFAN